MKKLIAIAAIALLAGCGTQPKGTSPAPTTPGNPPVQPNGGTTTPVGGTTSPAGGSDGGTPYTVSFVHDVVPVLQQSCAQCHSMGGGGYRGMRMFDASGVRYADVKTGIDRIVSEVGDHSMPPDGSGLSASAFAALTSWQSQGCPDN